MGSVLLIIALALLAYSHYLTPKYEGQISLKSIQNETTVYYDEYGVPHIYANTQRDAMIALGYVHAQDRLWQMELIRRIAPGRLSELFGSKLLKTDMFFAGLGIEEATDKALLTIDKNAESYQLASAYLEGINQYVEDGITKIVFVKSEDNESDIMTKNCQSDLHSKHSMKLITEK